MQASSMTKLHTGKTKGFSRRKTIGFIIIELVFTINLPFFYHQIGKHFLVYIEMSNRGVSGGWAIAHPYFGRLEGAAG